MSDDMLMRLHVRIKNSDKKWVDEACRRLGLTQTQLMERLLAVGDFAVYHSLSVDELLHLHDGDAGQLNSTLVDLVKRKVAYEHRRRHGGGGLTDFFYRLSLRCAKIGL